MDTRARRGGKGSVRNKVTTPGPPSGARGLLISRTWTAAQLSAREPGWRACAVRPSIVPFPYSKRAARGGDATPRLALWAIDRFVRLRY
eukprot:scaffold115885_cov54-Phaeocystis_antarctica.AAC.2